ncbi:hypothetical protein ACTFIR_006609 [Dictyostelium discoideum]
MDIPKFDFYRFSKIKLEDDQLFFKVWRNVNLRNKYIFYHLRIFNIANKYIKHNFNSLREYPLRNYLTVLNLIISKGDLPDTINSIKFGIRFKECIDNDTLPNNLIILRLGRHTEIGENLILPKSLEYLSIERKSQLSLLKKVKSSIKYLSIEECRSNTKIPTTIKNLGFTREFNNKLPRIPKNIEYLYIGNKFK